MLPDWLIWAAKDSDGKWHGFEYTPTIRDDGYWGAEGRKMFLVQDDNRDGWENSLTNIMPKKTNAHGMWSEYLGVELDAFDVAAMQIIAELEGGGNRVERLLAMKRIAEIASRFIGWK